MRVQRLASSLLEHVGPHLLDGPAQLFTEQENPEIDQLRDDQVSNLPKQLVVARIGDLGMEELIRAQIALDPRAADRRHRRRVEIRTEQPRRTQQRGQEKRAVFYQCLKVHGDWEMRAIPARRASCNSRKTIR